ncbi:MAG: tetraacyldisaccharide 4'-kinase [Dysgonamonadaceae bacterium]|nr:tetraacyldisaccharide 4'-kinase [Dysgonamonadaceae bacterium]
MCFNGMISIALLPLSWLYGAVVRFRNKLFDLRILPSEEFDIPVISVGNLAVGGTGKTPHIEYLIRLFLNKKYRVAILSRGYKRKTRGFMLADEHSDSRRIGDESYQIHRKFSEVTVAVDSSRRRGIRRLLALPGDERPEIILLDDAFQHRYVKPALSILLTDYNRQFNNDRLLPAGRLREPASSAGRADIIIVTKCPKDVCEQDGRFYSSFEYKGLLPVFPASTVVHKESLDRLKKENFSLLVVAGLANPVPLTKYLNEYTTDLNIMLYPDHHDFTERDFSEIKARFNNITNAQKLLVTTEKDAARIVDNPYVSDLLKPFIFYLPVEVVFACPEQEKLFIQQLHSYLFSNKQNRINI